MTEETNAQRYERLNQIIERNIETFERHPHYLSVGQTLISEEDNIVGIGVTVREIVDQETLSEESRIPDCIEGAPVIIEKMQRHIITS